MELQQRPKGALPTQAQHSEAQGFTGALISNSRLLSSLLDHAFALPCPRAHTHLQVHVLGI